MFLKRIIFLISIFFLAVDVFSQINSENPNIIPGSNLNSFKSGEWFEYRIHYGLFNAGRVTISLETKTFKYLKEKNIRVFNGLEMFIYQGQKAFYLWTKVNPEIDQKLIELLLSKLK